MRVSRRKEQATKKQMCALTNGRGSQSSMIADEFSHIFLQEVAIVLPSWQKERAAKRPFRSARCASS